KSKQVRKEYRALCINVMPFDSDYIDLPIGDDARHKDRMCVDVEGGKPSSTFYEVIERLPRAVAIGGATYLKAMPFTGRTHQIRVHLAHLGHPVVGDPLYGGRRARGPEELSGFEGLALHAHSLAFDHPADGRRLRFETPRPEPFERLIERLAKAASESPAHGSRP
ncbi:MAG TPA: RluA family pseudouridine synthase, partial [Candidatus Polarisedimenticolia bacterium]|nr:RluA family pseudouridine synthase [Candidatus Polarisedimenticolia bacterium]